MAVMLAAMHFSIKFKLKDGRPLLEDQAAP